MRRKRTNRPKALRYPLRALPVIWLLTCLVLTGCGVTQETLRSLFTTDSEGTSGEEAVQGEIIKAETVDINDVHLRDVASLYEGEDDLSVITMYLTVSYGNVADNTNHTWSEINTYSVYDYDEMGVNRYQIAALLQVGDEDGPVEGEVGYGETVPNATVQIRGQTSSTYAQKNYKVELKKNKGTWEDQRTINLNKHMAESLRFRNKMAYDLMEEIPQMMALRTQFVHLYVRDTTGDNPDVFEDYGLYTQVEQLNKTGMKAHGLDSEGNLYKVNYFEFYRYEDVIVDSDDPSYDLEAFEDYLEVKGNSDHSKLIEMLEAVNDYTISIDTILDTWFDTENLAYWMAFHILMGNIDTQSRNMYLYSPLNSNVWYIISWDNDGMLSETEDEIKGKTDTFGWEFGVSNYWGNVLFQRALKSESFRQELDDAIRDLRENYLYEEHIAEMAAAYAEVVKPYAFSMPDAMRVGVTEEEYDEIVAALPLEIERNYENYLLSLESPMPFFIGTPVLADGELSFNWDVSYDFDAETITYTVEVARDYLFEDVIYSQDGLLVPQTSMEAPEAGQYFVRVTAVNDSGYSMTALDYYMTSNSDKIYGTVCFYIGEDGSVTLDVYVEG